MAYDRHFNPKLAKLYRRKTNVRPERTNYLIVTEGATEEQYFKRFRRQPGPIVEVVDGQSSKRSLVEKALEIRDQRIADNQFNSEIDEAWVVFDRDIDGTNKKDLDQFNQALELAEARGMLVAWSNDAIELWFLLHYQHLASATHRSVLFDKLSAQIKTKYIKGKGSEVYALVKSSRAIAISRAKSLHEEAKARGTRPSDANPCTTVYQLVEKLAAEPGFRD